MPSQSLTTPPPPALRLAALTTALLAIAAPMSSAARAEHTVHDEASWRDEAVPSRFQSGPGRGPRRTLTSQYTGPRSGGGAATGAQTVQPLAHTGMGRRTIISQANAGALAVEFKTVLTFSLPLVGLRGRRRGVDPVHSVCLVLSCGLTRRRFPSRLFFPPSRPPVRSAAAGYATRGVETNPHRRR